MMISIVVLNFRVNASALAEVIMQFERTPNEKPRRLRAGVS
jgi:hypothetical protein